MKFLKHILLLIILVVAEFVSAQEEFSFQLFFEDAIGQRDTITLGYDPLATDTIDTAFGEVNILNQPWSDNLDVRIGDLSYENYNQLNWLTPNTYLSKRQILSTYCHQDLYSNRVSIQFYTENYPLTIKWNKTLFDTNACRRNSLFYGEKYWIAFDALDGTMLNGSDSITIQPYAEQSVAEQLAVVFKSFTDNSHWLYDYSLASYMKGTKEIGVLQFLFYNSSNLNVKEEYKNNVSVYPNPTNDFVTIDIENNENSELLIYQLDGTLIRKQTLMSNSNNISISDLNTGVYLFKIDSDKGMITKKVIKN